MNSEPLSTQRQNNREEIVSVHVKELRKYSPKELSELLLCKSKSEEEELIRLLRKDGILKKVKKKDGSEFELSELTDDCIIVGNDVPYDDFSYVFSYVGIIYHRHHVIKCYPKYLLKKYSGQQNFKETEDDKRLIDNELRLIVDVIKKYNSLNGRDIPIYTEINDESSIDLLAVYLYLLNDYFEFGVYTNTQEIIENNGAGEILWSRTINNSLAFIDDDCPYYIDFFTRKNIDNDEDYFKRLHECILTKISNELRKVNLLDIFGVAEVNLSDEELGYFGDDNSILYNIDKELNKQYNSRKHILLEVMRVYIQAGGSLNDSVNLSLYGTGNFNLVWEKVCANLFDNRLSNTLFELNSEFKIPIKDNDDPNRMLKDYIERPRWSKSDYAIRTYIPDIVSIKGGKFFILDAKYYVPQFEMGKPPVGEPGVESVTKQYFYQLAFKQFTDNHGFGEIKNAFLMPTEEDEVILQGTVSLDMFSPHNDISSSNSGNLSSELILEKIKVRFLPARKCYRFYLSDKKWDIDELELNSDN